MGEAFNPSLQKDIDGSWSKNIHNRKGAMRMIKHDHICICLEITELCMNLLSGISLILK